MSIFKQRFEQLSKHHAELIDLPNKAEALGNGIFTRWQNPVLTAEHTPLNWRYDLNPSSNPYFMERQGVNAVFNAGAMYFNDKHIVVARVEGNDRKSFFAVAESKNGIDGFQFWDNPITMPETDEPDTNVYDMRLTQHEDGYIYGLFCTERKDKTRMEDSSAAEAKCGIARTRDLITWERLPDLVSHSGQQRNVVLHPEWIDGQYGLYTRPQDGFISVGSGGGIGWGLCPDIGNAQLDREDIVDGKVYHTIKELKNGQGPTPIKTDEGWLHLAHGVRNTAAGLRYVLYMFLTDVNEPWRVTYAPAGHFMAPEGGERVGDVSNVVFCNGWIAKPDGSVLIYYASSDTRLHVATSTIEQLLDYVKNTPADGLSSAHSVKTRNALIARNLNLQD